MWSLLTTTTKPEENIEEQMLEHVECGVLVSLRKDLSFAESERYGLTLPVVLGGR